MCKKADVSVTSIEKPLLGGRVLQVAAIATVTNKSPVTAAESVVKRMYFGLWMSWETCEG